MSDPLAALLSYHQADEDGVMVLVSRQAIHETAEEVQRLRTKRTALLKRAANFVDTYDRQGEIPALVSALNELRAAVRRMQKDEK